jgi:hypothetical protein
MDLTTDVLGYPAWQALLYALGALLVIVVVITPTPEDNRALGRVANLLIAFPPTRALGQMLRRVLGLDDDDDPPPPPGDGYREAYGDPDDTPPVGVPDLGKPDERGDAMLRALKPVFAPVLVCLALLGCGASGAQVGHTIASGAAFGVLGVDTVLADAYAETKQRIESDESYTQNEARRRLDRLGRAQTALTIARPLLEEADEAIEDFDSSDEADREAMACALDAVVRLSSALVAAELELPERVTAFLTLSRLVPGQRCLRGAS